MLVTSPMFYNLCYEPWSRTCINCCDSKVTNIAFLESIQYFNMFQPAEISPLGTEIAPQISQIAKLPPQRIKSPPGGLQHGRNRHQGAISSTLNTTDAGYSSREPYCRTKKFEKPWHRGLKHYILDCLENDNLKTA